jgi:glyoxylase-like metal-dependent hydrolase (beta-lactamase superfamily II)
MTFGSEHFKLHSLADGVFAAIATPDGSAVSNAGIIDLGDRTLVFDTFNSVAAAEELRTAAERLTGRPADLVIISHAHLDHWCGNQVFPRRTPILATHRTRSEMLDEAQDIDDLKQDPSEMEQEIRALEVQLEAETDPLNRRALLASITRSRRELEALPDLHLRLPDQTFEGSLLFHGSRRVAVLMTEGRGHTDSDAFLILPDEHIVFLGDLGFFDCQPFMGDCDVDAWQAQLAGFEGSDFEVLVPGHGPLGSPENMRLQGNYIETLDDLVSKVVEEGGSIDHALRLTLPAPFEAWKATGRRRFEANVRNLYDRLMKTA